MMEIQINRLLPTRATCAQYGQKCSITFFFQATTFGGPKAGDYWAASQCPKPTPIFFGLTLFGFLQPS
jgi:hypothetical protein